MPIETRPFTDFVSAPGFEPDYEKLQFEILNHTTPFTSVLQSIPTPFDMNVPKQVGFNFSIALTGPENTELDIIVAAHDGTQLDRGVNVTAFSRFVDPTILDNAAAGFDDGDFFINKTVTGNPVVWQKHSELLGLAIWKRIDLSLATNRIDGLLAQTNQSLSGPSDTSEIVIEPGFCVSDSGTAIMVNPANKVIDLDLSGLNGLDTGSKTIDTKYDVYFITTSTGGRGGLFVLEGGAPVMPSGYVNKRWIGYAITDSGGAIIDFHVIGTGRQVQYIYRQDRLNSPLEVKSGGAATVWTDIDLSDIVPTRVSWVKLHIRQYNSVTTYFREFLNGEGIDQPFGSLGLRKEDRDNVEMGAGADMKIQYMNSAAFGSTEVQVVGLKVIR